MSGKCEKCKTGYGTQPHTIIYGDKEKKLCSGCVRKPGNGTCSMCKKLVKDTGNFLKNPENLQYQYICQGCIGFAYGIQKASRQQIIERCKVCKTTGKLKNCSKCKKDFYCSVDCQRSDWDEHKKNCQ